MDFRQLLSPIQKKQAQFYNTKSKKKLSSFSRFLAISPQKKRWKQQVINNKKSTKIPKPQQNTLWHWLALLLFGLLITASFTQQLLLLVFLIAATALIKGPGMMLFSVIYSFFVSLFPPLGMVLSLIIFLLNVGTFTKNWRVTVVGIFFYVYPVLLLTVKHSYHFQPWMIFMSVLAGVLLLHLFLTILYKRDGISRSIFWYLFSLPFMTLSSILPKKGTFKRWTRVKK